MPLELVYETHATTLDNERGIATGCLPGLLSAGGRAEAAELGERRRDIGLAAVYTSDLGRAVETVSIAFRDSGIPVRFDTRLRECDYGDLNGSPVEVLATHRAASIEVPFPGGQSYRDVVDHTRSLLADLCRDHGGGRVLVVAHSANRWALQHLLNGIPLEDLVDAPFDWQPGWY
ncbi:MAG: histidine phosphatase family protein, partial [Humibacillus sp.]|nr:histidine phosphatase family protein [Humibacillus sp.]